MKGRVVVVVLGLVPGCLLGDVEYGPGGDLGGDASIPVEEHPQLGSAGASGAMANDRVAGSSAGSGAAAPVGEETQPNGLGGGSTVEVLDPDAGAPQPPLILDAGCSTRECFDDIALTFCAPLACDAGVCGIQPTGVGTPLPAEQQIAGDCNVLVCDGSGAIAAVPDDTDVPSNPGDACNTPSCSSGVVASSQALADTPCGIGQYCDGLGSCVQCNNAAQCTGQVTVGQCHVITCLSNVCGTQPASTEATCDNGDACLTIDHCDGAGQCISDAPCDGNHPVIGPEPDCTGCHI
jgi:hypothetical protein